MGVLQRRQRDAEKKHLYSLHYYSGVSWILAKHSLSSEFVELIEPDAVRCKNSGKDVTSARRDEVTVRAWNLLNKVVRWKHSQQA